jgi:serine/threonine-protein kinase
VRWRRGLVGVGVLACAVAGVVGWQQLERRERVAACEAVGQSVASVWNDDVRGSLRGSLLRSGLAYADTTADGATRWLDEHTNAWARARTNACLDHRVRGVWDADTHDRSVACLDERSMELQALLTELSRGGARPVERAVSAAAALAPVGACVDADMLRRLPAAPAESREAIRAIRAELSRASALQATGAYDEGLTLARASLRQAEALGWPPLVATARLRVGSLLASAGDYREAEDVQESAFFDAARVDADAVAADAAIALTMTVGHHLARYADGVRWARLAEIRVAALPDRAGLREATRLGNLAAVHLQRGSNDEAIALFERALALKQSALGRQHPSVAGAMNNLAAALGKSGRYAEAKPLLEQALAIREMAQGGEHPDATAALSNLALVQYRLGSYEASRVLHERALAIREAVLGPEHPNVATSLSGLAAVLAAQGAWSEATALRERALSIREKTFGVEHPSVAASLIELATSAIELRGGDAVPLAERALSMRERSEAAPELVAEARIVLARALWIAGRDPVRARTLAEQGLAAFRRTGDAALLRDAEEEAAEILGGPPPREDG